MQVIDFYPAGKGSERSEIYKYFIACFNCSRYWRD